MLSTVDSTTAHRGVLPRRYFVVRASAPSPTQRSVHGVLETFHLGVGLMERGIAHGPNLLGLSSHKSQSGTDNIMHDKRCHKTDKQTWMNQTRTPTIRLCKTLLFSKMQRPCCFHSKSVNAQLPTSCAILRRASHSTTVASSLQLWELAPAAKSSCSHTKSARNCELEELQA